MRRGGKKTVCLKSKNKIYTKLVSHAPSEITEQIATSSYEIWGIDNNINKVTKQNQTTYIEDVL